MCRHEEELAKGSGSGVISLCLALGESDTGALLSFRPVLSSDGPLRSMGGGKGSLEMKLTDGEPSRTCRKTPKIQT
jgi:hypothetical protein